MFYIIIGRYNNKDNYNKMERSEVKDLKLAEWGRKDIELSEVEMPGLMNCREEFKNVL